MPTTTDFLNITIPDENDTSWTADMLDAFTKLDGAAETVSGTHLTASGTSLKGVVDIQGAGSVSIHPIDVNTMVVSGSASKSIGIENPNGAENVSFFHTPTGETISSITPTISGLSGNDGISWSLRFDSDRGDHSGATEVITGGTNTHLGNSGNTISTFDNPSIPADSHIWVETIGVSGSVDYLALTLQF